MHLVHSCVTHLTSHACIATTTNLIQWPTSDAFVSNVNLPMASSWIFLILATVVETINKDINQKQVITLPTNIYIYIYIKSETPEPFPTTLQHWVSYVMSHRLWYHSQLLSGSVLWAQCVILKGQQRRGIDATFAAFSAFSVFPHSFSFSFFLKVV